MSILTDEMEPPLYADPVSATTTLTAVLDLASATTQVELDTAIIRLATALVGSEATALHTLFYPKGGTTEDPEAQIAWIRQFPNGDEQPLAALPHYAAAVATGKPHDLPLPEGGVEVAYPIPGDHGTSGLLTARFPNPPKNLTDHLGPLLTAYHLHRRLLLALEHDALTSLHNRQTFDRQIWEVIRTAGHSTRHCDKNGGTICLAMLDIDHFKRVNDSFGHLYGDEVLLLFSRIINQTFRHSDLTFRYGGEEFCVVLFDVTLDIAARVLDRFRTAVMQYNFPQVGKQSVSIGYTQVRPEDHPDDLVGRADQALYYAKEHGRNQVCSYEHLAAEGELTQEETVIGAVELF